MSIFYLGIGSNQGERHQNLKNAIVALQDCGDLLITSSIYETDPMYETSQDKFLNMACVIETKLAAVELFEAVKTIEQQLGRVETFKNGPRVIDIDLLCSDEETYSDANLQIPHPRLVERAFVLVPLFEIAPDLEISSFGKISDLLLRLKPNELQEVKLFSDKNSSSSGQ